LAGRVGLVGLAGQITPYFFSWNRFALGLPLFGEAKYLVSAPVIPLSSTFEAFPISKWPQVEKYPPRKIGSPG